jgi:serine/threonine protein kinase
LAGRPLEALGLLPPGGIGGWQLSKQWFGDGRWGMSIPCPKCGRHYTWDGKRCCQRDCRYVAPAQPGAEASPAGRDPVPRLTPSMRLEEMLKAWGGFVRDLTQLARAGEVHPLPGRNAEVEQIIRILMQQSRKSAVLLDTPAAERSAIFDAVAFMIHVFGWAPALNACRLVALDLVRLAAEVRDRDLLTDQLQALFKAVLMCPQPIILMLSGLDRLCQTGIVLSPWLRRGLRFVAAVTTENYRRCVAEDPDLESYFQTVGLKEPTVAEAVELLRVERDKLEAHHRVQIKDEALQAAALLSARYIKGGNLPGKARDLLDDVGALLHQKYETEVAAIVRDLDPRNQSAMQAWRERSKKLAAVDAEAICAAVARMTGIPAEQLKDSLSQTDPVVTPPAQAPMASPAALSPASSQPPTQSDRGQPQGDVPSTGAPRAPATATPDTAQPGVQGPAAALPATLPQPFGRYVLVKKLGQGGMGAVYEAEDTQLGRRVALKVPHFTATADRKVVERFFREARVAAGIDHANICPLYDVGEFNGLPYLTMPLVDGEPLSRRVSPDRPFSARDAAAVIRTLALAVQVMHQRGVMHRDLKPSNIMEKRDGQLLIMDFGLARSYSGSDRLTSTDRPVGTPAYMPPEQISGDPGAMGPACDIYSLGVILYELVTGQLPFTGPPVAIFGQILHAQPTPPSALRPGLDRAFDTVCLKAMAKKAEERYSSMAEFAAALDGYLRRAAEDDSGDELRPTAQLPTAQRSGEASRKAAEQQTNDASVGGTPAKPSSSEKIPDELAIPPILPKKSWWRLW